MASIASIKRSRAAVKSSLTRFRQYVDAFVVDRDVETSGDPVELTLRTGKAENLLTQFNGLQEQIRELDVNGALTADLDAENTLFEGTYFQSISKAQQLLRSFEDREIRGQRAVTPANSEITHHNVKIPTIVLKHYDGSYEGWDHFYDMFLALVDSDVALSNVQKFYYLQSVLKDKAAQVISSLAITGANYAVALDLLKNRFENKRLTKRFHVRALLDIQPVTKESAVALRALYDDLCKHLRALVKLQEPVDKWDTLILELISNKLDPTTKPPFLATRCLVELALENATKYPQASEIIQRDFYVDDLITGGSNIKELRQRKHEITQILLSGAFPLAKWNSNSKQVLEIAESNPSISNNIGEDTKILGLRWRADTDQLYYHVNFCKKELRPTKRLILSFVAQLFDPLGLIGPAIIKTKFLLQHLWQLHVNWDETLPTDIHTQWMQYKTQIANLNNIIVPRHVLCTEPTRIELHGFCDASTKAYGACLYLKSVDSFGLITVRLLCAKSRVAPLKSLTLPRLELCGALLLARLYHKMHDALTVEIHCNYFWCDSSVTLAWIRGEPCRWKEFVRNRVIEIQELTLKNDWKHVCSEDNPADIISRGIQPDQLLNTRMWWQGPEWLSNNEDTWPISSCPPVDAIPEAKTSSVALTTRLSEVQLIERYSSLIKLQRVLAFILRFKNNAKACVAHQERQTGPLTTEELTTSLDVLVKIAQQEQFAEEFEDLKKKRDLSSRSKLLSLNPYIDDKNMIRVGGRLRNAPLSHDAKFPTLLPQKHTLTRLIILHYHHRNLHAGPSALLAALRDRYWIISARNVVRSVLRKCVTCFKLRPVSPVQLMGDLPSERVTPSRPFSVVGVDYAGPFNVKVSRNVTSKAYLCLFVCLATKAIHLEIVSDMTTEGFLNSFKRFISRRGRCRIIQSDNGSNFVGANNVMKKVAELLASKSHQQRVISFAANESIDWKFIPPYSPHVGGLWESAVKSAKTHAKAVIGETKLSFEELSTVFCQIEACLNSRPLSSLSTDPNELEALTPGHFLIGTSLRALPEEDVSDIPLNRLYRYQLLTRMNQDFWRRWSKEYVTQLQQRNKWKIEKLNENVKIGAMVLLRDITPPLNWRLGRIIELHSGKDGLIRTVTLKTQNGTTQRTLPKICVLPVD